MVDWARTHRYWQKFKGYSEDSKDVIVGLHELEYRRTKNPIYVWKAITRMAKIQMTTYPKWIRDYLGTCAKQIATCEPGTSGQSDVVDSLGFSSLRQLRKKDDRKISLAFDWMCYYVSNGKTIEDAAGEVEYIVNDDGLKPKQIGYLGSSKLEKIYRDLMKTKGPSTEIEEYLEAKEYMEREYKEAIRKGYKKDFITYCEELPDL